MTRPQAHLGRDPRRDEHRDDREQKICYPTTLMGADYNITRMVLLGRRHGIDLSALATLGRMDLHIKPGDLAAVLRDFDISIGDSALNHVTRQRYAEDLLRLLGACDVQSIDASAYEGATIVHDMNWPIPDALASRFSAIIDHGTTEHIYDFPTAMRNVMKMLAVGGHFLSATCANNFMGHGFYQFSPELYFRLFDAARGFRMKGVFLVEVGSRGCWYRVTDPAVAGERVTLKNREPTYVIVLAQKILDETGTQAAPQQSDYAIAWNGAQAPIASHGIKAALKRHLPARVTRIVGNLKYRLQYRYRWRAGFEGKPYFRRFMPHYDILMP